jgi:hypothetical protein
MSTTNELLQAQRKRVVASILGHAEREIYPLLSPLQRTTFRNKVLTSIDVYHDLVMDLIKVYEGRDDSVVNEEMLRLLRGIHTDLKRGA